MLTGVGKDSAGPGQYNMPDQKRIKGPVYEWKNQHEQSKKIQIIQREKQGEGTGPGSYLKLDNYEE